MPRRRSTKYVDAENGYIFFAIAGAVAIIVGWATSPGPYDGSVASWQSHSITSSLLGWGAMLLLVAPIWYWYINRDETSVKGAEKSFFRARTVLDKERPLGYLTTKLKPEQAKRFVIALWFIGAFLVLESMQVVMNAGGMPLSFLVWFVSGMLVICSGFWVKSQFE